MKIGELARLADLPIQTVRFYEQEELLLRVARTAGNFRIYGPSHVERLAFIRHCRSLDMTLDEIRVLLRLRDEPSQTCADVNRMLDEHIGHVAERMGELRLLEAQLKALRRECREASAARECGILTQLTREARATPRRTKVKSHVQGSHGNDVS